MEIQNDWGITVHARNWEYICEHDKDKLTRGVGNPPNDKNST